MRVPSAVRDFAREFDQGNYLGFILGARRLLQAAGALPALETSLKVMEGWAELADATVESYPEEPPEEQLTLLFDRARTRGALAEVTKALDALGDGSQLKLAGDPEEAEKGPALSSLEGAKGFLAEFAAAVAKLDEVRIPSWQARWTGQRPSMLPIDPSTLTPPLDPGDSKLTTPRADTQLLTIARPGHPVVSLEVDGKGLTAKQTTVTEFQPLGEVSDEDREVPLYEWVNEKLQEMKPKPARSFVMSCSFCGKAQNEVKKIVAGPSSCICNECTQLAYDIVNDTPGTHSGE